MYTRAYYKGMMNALRGAYNDYRKLGWLTWLFRLHAERMMRAHLHHTIRKTSAFFEAFFSDMPGNDRADLAATLTEATTYAVNWTKLK